MGEALIDLMPFANSVTDKIESHEAEDIGRISLAALKFNSETIDIAKKITTEGISEKERASYNRRLSEFCKAEIFEFSTCNRVLYVGFGIGSASLASRISKANSIENIPFDEFEGTAVWRQLVKICSGLDSFMMGELQVMSQFRKSINFHKEYNLISHHNLGFFEHVVAANRTVRKKLGFTSTTESMLSLATTALDALLEERGPMKTAVLGFGDMGMKAVEELLKANQTDIMVVSRDPVVSAKRAPHLAAKCNMISYKIWHEGNQNPDLIISTIRNATATYNERRRLPINVPTTIMDFSWPPSFDESGISDNQTLLGMAHWIKVSHNLGKEWDYIATIARSESIIDDIQERYMGKLESKAQKKFRAHVYKTLEGLSKIWEESPHASVEDVPQMGAFSREIATWICHQSSPFHLSSLSEFVVNTERELSSSILAHVDSATKQYVLDMSKKNPVFGGAS